MFNLRKYLYFLSTIGLVILLNTNSHSAETVGLDTAKKYSKDLVKLMMSGKKNKALIVNAINVVFFILAVVLAVVPAVLIARQCNPEFKVRYGILAFFFSDIYIFQWAIRKFVINEPEYCMML